MIIRGIEELYVDEEHQRLDIMIENFTGFLYFQASISKFITCIVTEKKLQELYWQITNDLKQLQADEEKHVLCAYWGVGRLFTIGWIVYTYFACVGFVMIPFIMPVVLNVILPKNESRQKSLCYYAQYYVDEQEYFYYLLLHTFICVSITILILSAIDSTFVCSVYHAIGLFNVLKYRMSKIFDTVNKDGVHNFNHNKAQLHSYVIDSIKMHNKTILLSGQIQSCYTDCLFFVTGLVLIALSVGTIDIMLNLNNAVILMRIGLVWVGIIFYLFYVSWPGQKLINSSYELFDAVYACGWYGLPLRTQHLIKFMMMRCSVPCQLTAGPLLLLNLETCGVILKSAMSYFTVVASFSQ